MAEQGLSEEDYAEVENWQSSTRFTDRERVAIEYADLFGRDHLAMDDDFWVRLRAEWADEEILDLSVLLASFLGLGRLTQVLDPHLSCPLEI